MREHTTGGGLKVKPKKRSLLARATSALLDPKRSKRPQSALQIELRQDRIRRRMTWPKYADFLGVHLSTLHKIAMGVHKPTELTEAIIRDTLDANPL